MIKKIQLSDLERCVSVICKSNATVAEEFGLTKENCPKHTSFMNKKILEYHWNTGFLMFGYYKNNDIIGYVSLSSKDNAVFELHNLSVLPEYRHLGYGKELLAYCIDKVKELAGSEIEIGIIEENNRLKNWYTLNGFEHIGVKRFDHLPFTVGFMKLKI